MIGLADLDECSEKLQTASEPPPALALENYVALFATNFFGLEASLRKQQERKNNQLMSTAFPNNKTKNISF